MINPDEISRKSQELDITTPNVQKDYILGWVLCGIFTISSFKNQLVLKGGNALRKGYFPTTRFSDDLDLSTVNSVDSTLLMGELNKVCKFVQESTGVIFEYEQNKIAEEQIIQGGKKVYKARLYFKDFRGEPNELILRIRVDVTEFDKLYLPTQKRKLIHPYSDRSQCEVEIQCIKLEEAMADKLKCLLQRRSSFDLFDLVYAIFINNEIAIDKAELITTFLKKTIFEPSPVVAKNLLLQLPFDFFKTYWEKYIICPKDVRMDFDDAITKLKEGLASLFETFSYGEYNADAYFPAALRNPILQAGHDITLLKLLYKGEQRLVEPYSLTFKRRKDGYGQEYFYAYDLTQDEEGPGIKCFINTNMQLAENTSEKFEPRFEVELSKAGEYGKTSYFSKPFSSKSTFFGSRPRSHRPRVALSYGRKYTIQCYSCGKKFTRQQYSTRLNPHRDSYGNNCYSRVGYLV